MFYSPKPQSQCKLKFQYSILKMTYPIMFTNFEHSKLYAFENLNLGCIPICKIFSRFRKLQPQYTLLLKKKVTDRSTSISYIS